MPITLIKPLEMQKIIGQSYSTAKRKVKAIREINNKASHQYPTVAETADFLGVTETEIAEALKAK